MSAILYYLYGFVPTGAPVPAGAPSGLDDRAVTLVELDGFAAAVSTLDAEVYGAGRLEARLGDLAWVGERGVRHETVVTWFADHTTIVPSRLFTLFTSADALRAEASSRGASIASALVDFRDLREWDLKVSYDRTTVAEHLAELSEQAATRDAEIRRATPGKRYLLERKRDAEVERESAEAARSLARRLLDELSSIAERVREVDAPATDETLPVVLSAALLVRVEHADRLSDTARRAAEGLERLGVHLSLTGPWAPYRFVGAEVDA